MSILGLDEVEEKKKKKLNDFASWKIGLDVQSVFQFNRTDDVFISEANRKETQKERKEKKR